MGGPCNTALLGVAGSGVEGTHTGQALSSRAAAITSIVFELAASMARACTAGATSRNVAPEAMNGTATATFADINLCV